MLHQKTQSQPSDSLLSQFQEQVLKHPDHIAVIYQQQGLTYDALNRKINQVAHYLLSSFPEKFIDNKHPCIGVIGNDKILMLIIQFAILKLGKTYVPLDHTSPRERIEYILQNANPTLILSSDLSKVTQASIEAIHNCSIPCIDISKPQEEISKQPEKNIYLATDNDSPAYILYTSGSTAKEPKGVVQTRKGVWGQIVNYTRDLRITDKDVLLQLAVFTHDQAMVDYFGGLLNGATVGLYDITNLDAATLLHFMKVNKVTIFSSIPSVFAVIFDGIQNKNTLPDLRIVTIGGEETKLTQVALYNKSCGDQCVLINGYGATECSWALYYTIHHQTDLSALKSIPLGIPTEGLEIYLDDSTTQEGQAELCIHSEYVSPGYWHNEMATNKAFVAYQDKKYYRTGDLVKKGPNNVYTFEGRSHWHEKIRGKRVNLHEIENALQGITHSQSVVITYGEDQAKKIYAFIEENESFLPKQTIIANLKSTLPEYMIPFDIHFMKKLPRLPNEKMDRQKLKEKLVQRDEIQRPLNPEESMNLLKPDEFIRQVWCQVLNVSEKEVNENFETLGGDSISAELIANKIKRYYEMKFGLVLDVIAKYVINNYTSVNRLISHVLILHSDTVRERTKNIYQSTLAQAENFLIFSGGHFFKGRCYYNIDFVGTVFNYEGMCVLANQFSQEFNINIKPSPSFADTLNLISQELRSPRGPGLRQVGFLLLRNDSKNSHSSPCVLVSGESGSATLFIADSLGGTYSEWLCEHPVICELKKEFPHLQIRLDLSARQADEQSCSTDAIHYLCEALRVNMLESVVMTGEIKEGSYGFISPPETFKNTQSQLPELLDQDRALKNDEKNRSLRQFLHDSTQVCRYHLTSPCETEAQTINISINTQMYKMGAVYKNIIDQQTQKSTVARTKSTADFFASAKENAENKPFVYSQAKPSGCIIS